MSVVNNDNAIVRLCFDYIQAAVPQYSRQLRDITTEHEISLLQIVSTSDTEMTLQFSNAMKEYIRDHKIDDLNLKMILHLSTLSVNFQLTSSRLSTKHDSLLVLVDVSCFNKNDTIGSNQVFVSTLLGDDKITDITREDGGVLKKNDIIVGYSTRFQKNNKVFAIVIGNEMYRIDFTEDTIYCVSKSEKNNLSFSLYDVSSIETKKFTVSSDDENVNDDVNEVDNDENNDDINEVDNNDDNNDDVNEVDNDENVNEVDNDDKKKSPAKKRGAPTKICQECGAVNHARRTKCEKCNTPFQKKSSVKKRKKQPTIESVTKKVKFGEDSIDSCISEVMVIADEFAECMVTCQEEISRMQMKHKELKKKLKKLAKLQSKK